MESMTINLSEDKLQKLKNLADQLGVSPEELIRLSLDTLLSQPDDALFTSIDYLLEKNAELYRRLA